MTDSDNTMHQAIDGTPAPASNTLAILERYHVLMLPAEINGAFWPIFLEAVLSHPAPITMHCAGGGGDAWVLFQMISMIQQHKAFTGVLLADAASAHSILFAACQSRYVSPFGSISVHRCLTLEGGQMNLNSARQAVERYERIDQMNAQIYADACLPEYDAAFWLSAFDKSTEMELAQYSAAMLITMGMAKPISEMSG